MTEQPVSAKKQGFLDRNQVALCGTKCLRHEAMLVHEKATSFCGEATLLFEKPILLCANVMLQFEKSMLLYARAMLLHAEAMLLRTG